MIAVMELAKRIGMRKWSLPPRPRFTTACPSLKKRMLPFRSRIIIRRPRLAVERIAELCHSLYGIDYTALRFFSVYGPHERAKGNYASMITQFLWSMQAGRAPVIYGDGTQTRDFTFVHDVTEAMIMAAWRGTGVFNVGTGKSFSFNYVVDLLNQKLGTNLKPEYKENPSGIM